MFQVVENIFKYLRLNEIIKQRIVCKLWHVIGTKLLVDRIDDVNIQFGTTSTHEKPDPRKTTEHFLRMEKSFSFKFTNFSTYYFENNSNGNIPAAAETENFLHRYGHHVKKIKFDIHGKNCWRFLSDVLTTMAPNVDELHLDGRIDERAIEKRLFNYSSKKPELKLKTIILHSEDEYEKPIYSRKLLTDLFQCSPHLERIEIALDSDQVASDRCNHEALVLDSLANAGNITNLKHVELSECTEDAFEILVKSYKRAPLETLHVPTTCIESIETLEHIESILEHHKDTLTDLYFLFPHVDIFMYGITFPKMINLTHLSINEWAEFEEDLDDDETHVPLSVINFAQNFPKLVTLQLMEDPKADASRMFFDSVKLFSEQSPLLSLRNLTLPPQFDASVLRRIGRIFPNVTKLQLTVQSADALKELWITWPQLKELNVKIVAAV